MNSNSFTAVKPNQSDLSITHCPVETTINMIGGKYKSLILWKLMTTIALRFSQLHREIPCATPKMLTQQLRELEANGLISRKVFPVVPPKVEYSLTDFGRSIKPVLEAMYKWGSHCLTKQGLEVNCSMVAITDQS
ncbi:HxlR family transcriptional regulator [Gilliamella sp. wkB178]|uniref:winged helix-turn-helix transcriptional regulator n=1 Tax=Gilliamella sp. wkB178 TaxID=3120259 RepID=UPI00080E6915|nr:helix-turn-helix domain-containing protein [Gilliamella apicola]OCG06982.1 HxlR family transcriptional regulator [Gilliamella apicola]